MNTSEPIRPIRTEADYAAYLAEIRAFDDDTYEPGTAATDRLDVLVSLVREHEARLVAMPAVDPIEMLHHAIGSMGRSQAELASLLGSKSRASEVLNRRRPLTLDMIRAISSAWKIPEGCLTGAYLLVEDTSGKRPRRQAAGKRGKECVAA